MLKVSDWLGQIPNAMKGMSSITHDDVDRQWFSDITVLAAWDGMQAMFQDIADLKAGP